MKSFLKKFLYAANGIRFSFRDQINFRIHMIVALMVIAGGIFLEISRNEWLILFIWIILVLSAEMINTAIELITDKVYPEWNETAGKIKDIAAGAVFLAVIGAVLSGLFIFLPKLLPRLEDLKNDFHCNDVNCLNMWLVFIFRV